MLDKKQIWVIFLFRFKMGCKAAETTHNIKVPLAQELLMNIQCSGGWITFAKEKKALKMRSAAVVGDWKLTTTNWEYHQKLIPLQLHKKLPKNSMSTIPWSFSIWSKLGRWKGPISGCLMSWLQINKNRLNNNNGPFLNQLLMCEWKVDFIQQLVMNSSVVGPRRNFKPLPKAKHAPKKGMVTLCWSAARLTHYSFLNPGKTIISERYAQQIDGKWKWKC